MTPSLFHLGMLLLGGAVGLISAALGLGGGVLMVPAFLEFVPGMDAHTAKGTSLFIIVFVALANVWRLNRGVARIEWGLAAVMACGSIAGSWLGVWITSLMHGRAVLWCFIAMMVVGSARTLLLEPKPVSEEEVRRRNLLAMLIGLMTGTVAGATGIGGGAVLVPLALMAGVIANERVVALSNTVMVATCLAGTVAHFSVTKTADLPWTYGQVNMALAPLVFLGAQVGAPFGKRLNEKLTLPRRKVIMAVLLLAIAARLAYRALTGGG